NYYYSVGQYTLIFEGPNPEKAALLGNLLDNLYTNLQSVIQDLRAPRSIAFDTFFIDQSNKAFVRKLFENVVAGAPPYPLTNPPRLWESYSPGKGPIFLVVSQLDQWVFSSGLDVFTYCNENSVSAFVTFPEAWPMVCLCPAFFERGAPYIYGDTPPVSDGKKPASSCLKVTRLKKNFQKAVTSPKWQPAGHTLTQYRSWILLEELAHVYYEAEKRVKSLDVYDVNKARKLSARDAVANGPSYSYYAACESCSFISPFFHLDADTDNYIHPPAVAGRCKDFPTISKGDGL
ncbi:MAG: hypothetical protein Q9174_005023, partial [Haloplaca sp. 1 TL-2023]